MLITSEEFEIDFKYYITSKVLFGTQIGMSIFFMAFNSIKSYLPLPDKFELNSQSCSDAPPPRVSVNTAKCATGFWATRGQFEWKTTHSRRSKWGVLAKLSGKVRQQRFTPCFLARLRVPVWK